MSALYDEFGTVVYQSAVHIVPGVHVCLVDRGFNQLSSWTTVDVQWQASWPVGQRDGQVFGYLARDDAGRFAFMSVDMPLNITKTSMPITLNLWPTSRAR